MRVRREIRHDARIAAKALINFFFRPRTARAPVATDLGGKRVLILMLTHLGDSVISLPLIRSVVSSAPSTELHIVVKAGVDDLLTACPSLKVHAMRCPWVGAGTWARNWLDAAKLILELRAQRFDIAIVTHPHFLTSLTARLSGAKFVIGYGEPGDRLLHSPIAAPTESPPGVRRDILAGSLGIAVADRGATWPFFDPTRLQEARKLIVNWLVSEMDSSSAKGFICIHPGAGGPAKVWPWRNFVHLLRSLPHETRVPVVLLGGKKEVASCALIEGALVDGWRVLNLSDRLGIQELFGVLSGARVYIGNDSGPSHLAALAEVPSVVIFGPASNAQIWRPTGANVEVVDLGDDEFDALDSVAKASTKLRRVMHASQLPASAASQ
jgi:ADP-heptose:LPS heptosyltransferase